MQKKISSIENRKDSYKTSSNLLKSFKYAFSGISYVFKTSRNFIAFLKARGFIMLKTAENAVQQDSFAQRNDAAPCKSINFIELIDTKSYITLPSCLLDMLFSMSISEIGKIYYMLADCLIAVQFYKTKNWSVQKAGVEWSDYLKQKKDYLYTVQAELEKEGLFDIKRGFSNNKNIINTITTTLPETLFKQLIQDESSNHQHAIVKDKKINSDKRRSQLNKNKLFIKLNLKLFLTLLADETLSTFEKLLWVYAYQRSYIAYQDNLGEGTRRFLATYKELQQTFGNMPSKSKVSRAIKKLIACGYLNAQQIYMRCEQQDFNRRDKSVWEFEALFPQAKMDVVLIQPNRAYVQEDITLSFASSRSDSCTPTVECAPERDVVAYRSHAVAQRSHSVAPTPALNNKHNIKPFNNKNFNPQPVEKSLEEETILEQAVPEKVILKTTDPKQSASIINGYLNKIDKYQQLGFTEFEAKKQAVKSLSMDEKILLFEKAKQVHVDFLSFAAGDKQQQLAWIKKRPHGEQVLLQELLQPPEQKVLFAGFDNPEPVHAIQKTDDAQYPAQPPPKGYLSGPSWEKINAWVDTMDAKGERRGYAGGISVGLLKTEIAFFVQNFKPKHPMPDPTNFAIYLACKKVREGLWEAPYGLAHHREQQNYLEKVARGEVRQE